MPLAGFAVVRLGTDKSSGEEFAIKIMALPEVGRQTGDNENTREDIFKEIDILVGMEHENVIFMKEYYEENNKVSHTGDIESSFERDLVCSRNGSIYTYALAPKRLNCGRSCAQCANILPDCPCRRQP